VEIQGGRYVPPQAPGYSSEMQPESLSEFEFPEGSAWTTQERSVP
jgi:L-fuconate dehydratase